ncbi:MAG: CDP-diacylglycerol--glycerol-3-phosphate 3-phosphatidyltransferase [Pseudobdellovibrionaceae bacterium]
MQVPNWKMQMPMWITMSRVVVVPFLILLMIPQHWAYHLAAGILFILASISDYYDGYFARKFNAVSTMGKLMDPVADKILVSSILIFLIPSGRIDPYLVIVLLGRDTIIAGIRAVAAAENLIIDAKAAGKWKTGLQMTGIPMVIIGNPFGVAVVGNEIPIIKIGYFLLWVSVTLSLWSGYQYIQLYKEVRRT